LSHQGLVGSIDIWVPQLNYLHQDWAHYQARHEPAKRVWFYTCVFPQGELRTVSWNSPDQDSVAALDLIPATALLVTALHWGYNQWTERPLTHTTRPHGGPPYLPAGDPWIV